MATVDQYDVFGITDQLEALGGPDEHERALMAALAKVAVLQQERTDVGRPERRGMFGTPPWYEEKCEALSAAHWRGQVSEEEGERELALWYRVAVAMTDFDGARRRLERARQRREKKAILRFKGWRCAECGGPVGALTGICLPCHALRPSRFVKRAKAKDNRPKPSVLPGRQPRHIDGQLDIFGELEKDTTA